MPSKEKDLILAAIDALTSAVAQQDRNYTSLLDFLAQRLPTLDKTDRDMILRTTASHEDPVAGVRTLLAQLRALE